MNPKRLLRISFLLVILASACTRQGSVPTPSASQVDLATGTPQPAFTGTPSLTPTLSATQTSLSPSPTWTASTTYTPFPPSTMAYIVLDAGHQNPHGYSFRAPVGWSIDPTRELDGTYILFGPGSGTIVYLGVGICLTPSCLPDSVDGISLRLGGRKGLSWDCSSSANGCRTVQIPLGDGRFLGMRVESSSRDRWTSEGLPAYQAIAASFQYFQPHVTPCEQSFDPNYGLVPENPIQIGGGALGLQRIEGFMYGLSGTGGTLPLLYERQPEYALHGLALDVYTAQYSYGTDGVNGPRVTLYFDRYSYQQPLAPIGFSCAAHYFPFGEP
jgi:hypothetical protein